MVWRPVVRCHPGGEERAEVSSTNSHPGLPTDQLLNVVVGHDDALQLRQTQLQPLSHTATGGRGWERGGREGEGGRGLREGSQGVEQTDAPHSVVVDEDGLETAKHGKAI